MNVNDLPALLAPLATDDPCGPDLAFSGSFDAIARLREQDDPTLEQGAWVTPLKVADWPGVERICAELLASRSKDLRLAGWWAEACLHVHGWPGLAAGLELADALLRRYGERLHPRPEAGDHELRIGALGWLLTRVAALAPRLPLPGDAAALATQQAGLAACEAALQALQHTADATFGEQGPAFSPVRDALAAAGHALRQHGRDAGWAQAPGAPAMPLAAGGAAHLSPSRSASPSTLLADRDQAVQALRQVAQWFRQHEPHSPVAYLADKAARWADMPLHDWLRSVVKDAGSLAHLEELLGVPPAPPPVDAG